LRAVHGDGDHAAAGGGLHFQFDHLLLHALLHLLRLLHQLLRIHRYISSTSLISAANTSSIVWTPLSESARSFSACARLGASRGADPVWGGGDGGADACAAVDVAAPSAATTEMRPAASGGAARSTQRRRLTRTRR